MSDPHPTSPTLSEIGHLFLSSVRQRQTDGAPMPRRRPPGGGGGAAAREPVMVTVPLRPTNRSPAEPVTVAVAAQRPQMSEEVFKNVQVLKGIPVNEFLGIMGFFSASLISASMSEYGTAGRAASCTITCVASADSVTAPALFNSKT